MALFASEQTSSSSTSDYDPWDLFHSNGVSTATVAKANNSFNPLLAALQQFPNGFPKIPTDNSQCNPQSSNKADLAHQSHHPKIMELKAGVHPAAETSTLPFILPSTDVKKTLITLKCEHQKREAACRIWSVYPAGWKLLLNVFLLFSGTSKEGMQCH